MKPEASQIKPAVNLVYNEVKKKLEDTKTVSFIILSAINIFLWGLLLAEYREIQRDLELLQDKHDVTQVYINQLKAKNDE